MQDYYRKNNSGKVPYHDWNVKCTLKFILSFVYDKEKKKISNFQILLMHKRAKCSRRNTNINISNTLKELHLQAKSIFAIKKADNERKWKRKERASKAIPDYTKHLQSNSLCQRLSPASTPSGLFERLPIPHPAQVPSREK